MKNVLVMLGQWQIDGYRYPVDCPDGHVCRSHLGISLVGVQMAQGPPQAAARRHLRRAALTQCR